MHPIRLLAALRRSPWPLLTALAWGAGVAAPVEVSVLDSNGRPLPQAVVYLDSDGARAAVKPLTGVEIAQQDKQFSPQLTVVTRGTSVLFPNHDRVRHHVYSLSPTNPFELKLYAGKPANPVTFDQPGVAVLGCNIHDAMVAWVVVLDTPFHGITGADGKVTLPDVPPGDYTMRSWHAGLPPGAAALHQPLAVAATGARAVSRLAVTPP